MATLTPHPERSLTHGYPDRFCHVCRLGSGMAPIQDSDPESVSQAPANSPDLPAETNGSDLPVEANPSEDAVAVANVLDAPPIEAHASEAHALSERAS